MDRDLLTRTRRAAIAALAGLFIAGAVGCSSEDTDATPTPTTTTVTTTETAVETSGDSITAETITACSTLAEDRGLSDYWTEVATGTPSAGSSVAAANAVRNLEVYLPQPEVDPTVVSAIQEATDAVAADATLPARPDEFRTVVTPIVDACMALDIDMAVD